ncbi:peptidase [Oerskovia sp. M15]
MRGLLVAGLLGATALVAPAAHASVEPSEPPAAGDYVETTPPPTIALTVLQPVCDGDVPYLEYDVDVTGTPNDTVTITWLNPSGSNVVQAAFPLRARPVARATVNAAGEPTGWPGWVFEDGEWVEGGTFGWVRPSVDVLFQVNPETTVTVDYPPSSPDCVTDPREDDDRRAHRDHRLQRLGDTGRSRRDGRHRRQVRRRRCGAASPRRRVRPRRTPRPQEQGLTPVRTR